MQSQPLCWRSCMWCRLRIALHCKTAAPMSAQPVTAQHSLAQHSTAQHSATCSLTMRAMGRCCGMSPGVSSVSTPAPSDITQRRLGHCGQYKKSRSVCGGGGGGTSYSSYLLQQQSVLSCLHAVIVRCRLGVCRRCLSTPAPRNITQRRLGHCSR
jgi:hypothetical protein